jgi:PAS domain S-box-containing protein
MGPTGADRVISRNLFRDAAIFAGVLAIYLLAGKVGLALASINESISPVWAPTGISLAALLLFGARFWPAILVGAFVTNLTTCGSISASAPIAAGNTLEALLGTFLVRRFANGDQVFARPSDILRFVLFAGVVATLVSSTIGVLSLRAAGLLDPPKAPFAWLTWWLADMAGALVVTPAIVLWAREPRPRWERARILEACLLLAVLGALTILVFAETRPGGSLPLEYLCILPLLWAAFRFGPRETVTAGVLLSAAAILATLDGRGPFAFGTSNESLLALQTYMGVSVITSLAINASVLNRERAEQRVRALNAELEELVARRTSQLLLTNQELTLEVAERRNAEEELRRSEERLNQAQHITHVGSWSWDIAKNRLWWSDELYRIFGVDPSSFTLSYEGFMGCVHLEDRDRVAGVVERALRDCQPFTVEHRVQHLDGSVRIVFGQGTVMIDERGQALSMLGTCQDITDRRRAEAEREQLAREQAARREAEEANRAKDDFLAVLSHELRTPLNAIVGWAELLRGGALDAETSRKAVDTILRNGKIQTQLISDILDVSRIVSGTIPLEIRDVEVPELAHAAVDTLRPMAQTRGVRLDVSVDATSLPVRGDPFRLQQVIWNLLSNAIKFAPERLGQVQLRIQAVGQDASIAVIDNGPGIDPKFLPHVFERFRQADPSSTRLQGGLGLGLAIVRHLVEMHHGAVQVRNRTDGSGAVFTVTLPLSRPAPGPSAARVESSPALSIQGLRVLVVDDEPDARHLVRVFLESCGARVLSADSVAAAMTAIQRELPDVVLTDIAMPIEDGYALLRRVRALSPERGGRLPVAAITAYASADDKHKLRLAGFQGHLTKPFQLAALRQLVIGLGSELERPARTS